MNLGQFVDGPEQGMHTHLLRGRPRSLVVSIAVLFLLDDKAERRVVFRGVWRSTITGLLDNIMSNSFIGS